MSASSNRIACPACGKQFVWKESLTGKQVRCKCGHVFEAVKPALVVAPPPPMPAASTQAEVEAFELYPEFEPAKRPKATVAVPVTHEAPDVAGETPTAPQIPSAFTAYAARPRRAAMQEEDTSAPSVWKDRYIPIALGTLGLIGWVVMTVVYPLANVSPGKALVVAGTMIVANIIALVLSLFAAASLLSVNFGPPGTALIKLVGTALLAGAVFFACMRMDYPKDIRGTIVGLHAALLVYWACFATLFDLELQEVAITVAIVGLIQAMAGCVVMKV